MDRQLCEWYLFLGEPATSIVAHSTPVDVEFLEPMPISAPISVIVVCALVIAMVYYPLWGPWLASIVVA